MMDQILNLDSQILVIVPSKFPNNANILCACTNFHYRDHKTFCLCKHMKGEMSANSTSLPKVCSPHFSANTWMGFRTWFSCSWTGESLQVPSTWTTLFYFSWLLSHVLFFLLLSDHCSGIFKRNSTFETNFGCRNCSQLSQKEITEEITNIKHICTCPISVFSPQTGKKIDKQNQTHSNILTSIFKQEKETNVHLINLLCLVHLKAQVML